MSWVSFTISFPDFALRYIITWC